MPDDDSFAKNGPSRVLPGTHAMGVLNDDTLHDLSIQIAPVDCLVPQEGVLVMRPLVIHASSKSRSGTRRRVLHIEYAACARFAEGLELATT